MIVEITDYGKIQDKNFVDYSVRGLTSSQMDFLKANLDEETKIDEGVFKLKMYFDDKLYPFQSDVAQFRLEDFIAREEIEMNVFLSSFLEDM
ncbi:MAG: hypothetical protein E7Z77_06205 [Methanobrevibacter sp.]|uniref:DUF5750 family protein n=1 Tax=Methanobrevibacter sp. TaxID=66852 RepID=UPI0025D93599|nr:DUF5750 family protein [Methanobrevibacter sp.]MBE6508994.1 hypothetical protein [Methanobrevibacter sp.]